MEVVFKQTCPCIICEFYLNMVVFVYIRVTLLFVYLYIFHVAYFYNFFYIFCLAFDFCRFCVVIRFFHPRHNGQFPILILEKEPVFPFLMFSSKQGNYWYHLYNVFGMTRSLTGDEPSTSRTRSQHSAPRLSMRRYVAYKLLWLYVCVRLMI